MGDPRDVLALEGEVRDNIRFDAFIDEGGFGYVYRAFHQGLGVPVAVKCLKISGDTKFGSFAARFRDETKIAYKLSQGCLDIVRSVSSGTLTAAHGVEVPYMVLEWLDGQTLEAAMYVRKEQKKPPMELLEAFNLLDSAANALSHAHAEGVVHRDVKPSNLFLSQNKDAFRLKVLDFGLAKIVDTESFMTPESGPTATNIFVCSPAYGAPEQFAKEVGDIGAWTDVYSFAFVFMELLTGEKVREADSLVEGMVKALDPSYAPTIPANLSVPDSVKNVLTKATALSPKERYQAMPEFWRALRAAMDGAVVPKVITANMPKNSREEAIKRVQAFAANTPINSRGGTLMMKDISGERARAMAQVQAAKHQMTLPIGAQNPLQNGGFVAVSRTPSNSPALQGSPVPPAPSNIPPRMPSTPLPPRPPSDISLIAAGVPPKGTVPVVIWVVGVLVLGLICAVGAYAIVRSRH